MTEPIDRTDLERANSPDSSADDLGKLAFSNEAFVVDAVLANPNPPPERIAYLPLPSQR